MINSLSAGDTAVDIGAHKGAYTYWMHKAVGRMGKVFSFEPQPMLAAYLKAMRVSLGLDHVRVEEMGISSRIGSGELFVPGSGSSPSATLDLPQEILLGQLLMYGLNRWIIILIIWREDPYGFLKLMSKVTN